MQSEPHEPEGVQEVAGVAPHPYASYARLLDQVEAATTVLVAVDALVGEWRRDHARTVVDEWQGSEQHEGRGLYRVLGDVRACVEAARQDSALVQRVVRRATDRLEALLAIPDDRPHDERAESIEHLHDELNEIHELLAGAHVATAGDNR